VSTLRFVFLSSFFFSNKGDYMQLPGKKTVCSPSLFQESAVSVVKATYNTDRNCQPGNQENGGEAVLAIFSSNLS